MVDATPGLSYSIWYIKGQGRLFRDEGWNGSKLKLKYFIETKKKLQLDRNMWVDSLIDSRHVT